MILFLPQVIRIQFGFWWQRLCDWVDEPDDPDF